MQGFKESKEKKANLEKEGYPVTSDISFFFQAVEIIILCIKPQGFDEVMKVASSYSYDSKCVVSIAAGITLSYLEKYFKGASLIRAMPSTPCLIKQGVTTIAFKEDNKFDKVYIKQFVVARQPTIASEFTLALRRKEYK